MVQQTNNKWNDSASQNFSHPFQYGEEARKTLDSLLSGNEGAAKYPGPRVSGYYEESREDGQKKYVAFDNRTLDCYVEEFDEEWQAALYAGTTLSYGEIVEDAPKERQWSIARIETPHGTEDVLVSSLEREVMEHVSQYLEEVGSTAKVTGAKLYDPELYGTELDDEGKQTMHFLVELSDPKQKEREDNVFNGLHEDPLTLYHHGVDINPILPYQSGTIDEYLRKNKDHSIPENMTFQEMANDITERSLAQLQRAAEKNGGIVVLSDPVEVQYTTISNGDILSDNVVAVSESGTFYAVPEGETVDEDYDFEEDPDGVLLTLDSTELEIRSLAEVADRVDMEHGSRLQEAHLLIQESMNEIASAIGDKTLFPHASNEFQYDDPDCVSVQYNSIKSMTADEIEWSNGTKSSIEDLLESEIPILADAVKEWSQDIRNYSPTPRILNPSLSAKQPVATAEVDGRTREFSLANLAKIDLIKLRNQSQPEREQFLTKFISEELANTNSRTNSIHR